MGFSNLITCDHSGGIFMSDSTTCRKRIISFLMAVVLVLGMMPMPHVHAAETGDDHSYTEEVPVETALDVNGR